MSNKRKQIIANLQLELNRIEHLESQIYELKNKLKQQGSEIRKLRKKQPIEEKRRRSGPSRVAYKEPKVTKHGRFSVIHKNKKPSPPKLAYVNSSNIGKL